MPAILSIQKIDCMERSTGTREEINDKRIFFISNYGF